MRRFQQFRTFVLALSGAHREVLELVPSDRARFESLGWAILITSGMAAVSMWFALASAVGINGILALPIALLWGIVIMGIDRWLITSMPVDGNRKFAMAVPRVVLAVLLGTLISTPLVLRIFQSEINAQIAVMQENSYNTFLRQQQQSQVASQVKTYSQELQNLNEVISSHGAATGNTAGDPQLVAYNAQLTRFEGQLNHWTALKTQYYNAYICQLYGGPTCPKKGLGPAAQASHQSYLQASAQVTTIQGQITAIAGEIRQRDSQLNSTSKQDQQARYQEAVTQQPLVQDEYNTAVQRQNALQAAFFAQNQASHGILVRLEALSQLSDGNITVAAARLLLFLLFLVIECLPVTVKLLQRPGQYEAALVHAREAERRRYEKVFSSRSRVGLGGSPSSSPDAAPIWQRTMRMPSATGVSEDQLPTEMLEDRGSVPGGRAGYFPPGEQARPRQRWHGADAWREHWGEPEAEESRRGDNQRGDNQRGDNQRRDEQRRDEQRGDRQRADERRGYERRREEQPREAEPWEAQRREAQRREAQRGDAPAPDADPRVTQTRPDFGYVARMSGGDDFEAGRTAAEMEDDEPVSARSDGSGGGIPLTWDDE